MVDEQFHESLIKQHYQDIKNYKVYQKSLKPQHRYENTIEKIIKQHETERILFIKQKEEEEKRRYDAINKLYRLDNK